MSGKPAARQGDMTQYGGSIVQGSAGVRIGAPTGVACSVCPGGVTSGHPVNPLLGAKVLPGETDIALPGPLPFILSRTYSSYRTKTPAPVGSLGPGWKMPADIRLQLRDNTLTVSISCPSCSATDGVVRNGKSTAGHQRYLCSHCRKTWQLQFTYTASQPGTHQKI
ncbi:IS1 family transposase, partial [Escherichia coli]|uniref:IS1 family transposase n=1 Tax=Escherichia coli TaxID=562 RepID=UPI00216A654F